MQVKASSWKHNNIELQNFDGESMKVPDFQKCNTLKILQNILYQK